MLLFLFFLIKNNVPEEKNYHPITQYQCLYLSITLCDLYAHIFETMIMIHSCSVNTWVTFKAYFPGDAKRMCVSGKLPVEPGYQAEARADAAPCWLAFSSAKVPGKGHFNQVIITYSLGHQAKLTHLQGLHLRIPLQKGSLTQWSSSNIFLRTFGIIFLLF